MNNNEQKTNRIPTIPIVENPDVFTNIHQMTKAEVIYDLYKASLSSSSPKSISLIITDYNRLVKCGIIQEISEEEMEAIMSMMCEFEEKEEAN